MEDMCWIEDWQDDEEDDQYPDPEWEDHDRQCREIEARNWLLWEGREIEAKLEGGEVCN
jgi:hypothetical protein